MSFVAVAIGGAGLLSAGASIYGASKSSDAANRAAALQQQQMATNSANAQPFITGGQGASNMLQSFYGIGGQPLNQGALDAFYKSPDYQFALKGGSEALNNSLASKSGGLGGNAILAQTQFGSGLATQNLGNYLQRLSGMAGQGIQAAGNVAGVNTIGANYAGQDMMGAGTAQAAGANGLAGAFNSTLGNYLTQYGMMNKSSYGGGASAGPMTLGGPGGPVAFT